MICDDKSILSTQAKFITIIEKHTIVSGATTKFFTRYITFNRMISLRNKQLTYNTAPTLHF